MVQSRRAQGQRGRADDARGSGRGNVGARNRRGAAAGARADGRDAIARRLNRAISTRSKPVWRGATLVRPRLALSKGRPFGQPDPVALHALSLCRQEIGDRSEEHTSELQSLMRTSYAVVCLKKKKYTIHTH